MERMATMLQPTTRRRLAGSLLGLSATMLAACGMGGGPTQAMAGADAYHAYGGTVTTHRYSKPLGANAIRVRYVDGDVMTALPRQVDLRDKMGPIDDQGQVGACSGFAIAGMAEYRERQLGKTALLSPGFIYVLELKAESHLGKDDGAEISDGMKVLQQYGIAPRALHPYLVAADQTKPAMLSAYLGALPNPAAMKAALANRITSSQPVKDLSGFKMALATGKPVVFGIDCYTSMDGPDVAKTGIIPVPDTAKEKNEGGHAICAVGYDDGKKQILFRNSWSTAWGDRGYGYLPYAYFKGNMVGDAWVAN
jgi:C1A family cysteine protease